MLVKAIWAALMLVVPTATAFAGPLGKTTRIQVTVEGDSGNLNDSLDSNLRRALRKIEDVELVESTPDIRLWIHGEPIVSRNGPTGTAAVAVGIAMKYIPELLEIALEKETGKPAGPKAKKTIRDQTGELYFEPIINQNIVTDSTEWATFLANAIDSRWLEPIRLKKQSLKDGK